MAQTASSDLNIYPSTGCRSFFALKAAGGHSVFRDARAEIQGSHPREVFVEEPRLC